MIAQYKKPKEIKELVEEQHGINVKTTTISKFKQDEKELIGKLRAQYLETVVEVPIAQKRVRLERAEGLYESACEIDNSKDRIDTRLKCLSNARDEVEGKGSSQVTFAQYNQYNNLSDDELNYKIREIEEKVARARKVVEVKKIGV